MTEPTMHFMSQEHVDWMNARLAADEASRTECAKLSKRYVMGHRLADGPDGATVYWSMIFDPAAGLEFSLAPHSQDTPPDSVCVTSYANMIRFTMDQQNAEKYASQITTEGDSDPMVVIGAAFAAGHAAAAVKCIMPEV